MQQNNRTNEKTFLNATRKITAKNLKNISKVASGPYRHYNKPL